MRKAILTFVLILLVPAFAAAAETVAVSDHPEAVTARVVESDVSRTVLEYEIGSFTKTAVDIEGETFYSIGLADESTVLEAGLPELPNVCRSIVIPDDAEMAVRVVSSHYVDFPGVPVAPSKGNLTRDVDPAAVPYTFDPFYGTDGWYPSPLAYTREPYIMRDVRGLVVVVNPLQYNPATRTLRVYDRVVVEVERVGPGKVNVLTQRPAKLSSEFRKMYERHFLNFDSSDLGRYPAVADGGSMLVICYDDPAFLAAMQPLVDWKNQMGVPCEMVTTTDAGGTAAAIDAYITQYYNDHGVTYVLLVGDAAQVPTLTAAGGSSDPSYATVTADMYPDLFVGRFSAEAASQVETQVLRTIEYEKRPQIGADWYHKGMGVASDQGPGDDGEYDYEHVGYIRDDLLGFTYTEVDEIYDPTATAAMVTAGLNEGRSIINYCGHGSTTSWGTTGFSNTDVNALTNDNMLPFIFSVACVNGQFAGYTCFGEAWLRATNGGEPTGAIGAYMSSINQSWDPPMDAEDEMDDLLVGTSAQGVRRTFGGLCYNGCGHMMDEYGTNGEDMFLTWHIFGDPSLRVRTDTPSAITVNHLPVIYPSMTTFDVEVVGVEEALCALYGNGVLYGSALTDASGNATIPIGTMPPVGETLTLTVTAFNTETYTADIPVIVPVTYDIDPPTIPINATTPVTITVWDDGGAPLPDVEITVDGWGIAPQVDVTDGAGQAHFSLTPPYGEDLTVVASEIGETYNCFEDVIPVTGASDFASADIEASVPAIGLYGSLTPHYEGTITGTTDGSAFLVMAAGCGVDASAGPSGGTSLDLLVTPTSTGTITAAIAKKGFNVYLEDVTVEVVYGQLAGAVYDASSAPIVGALVKGYPAGSDTTGATPVFSVVSGTLGAYSVPGDLEVGYYDTYVSKFGYLTLAEEVFVQYGANDVDFYLESAPSGEVSGTVTESGTGTPLEATVKVYRSDTMELYAETTSDPVTGWYTVTLPYFNYVMNVRAYHHIPENRGISVSTPSMTEDFVLEETLANILVIEDAGGEKETVKLDKAGNVIDVMTEQEARGVKSADQISADLTALGYDVTQETVATTNPATWLTDYDFIISSSGDNTSPVASQSYRDALESYVAAGGKLIVEGGEVAYDSESYPGYPTFCANVLHVLDWTHDSSGNVTVANSSHPVTTFPNVIGTITMGYSNYGDADASVPTSDAEMVCNWSSYPSDASVIVYDDNPNPQSGQIVFFQFDYAEGGAGITDLLENAVTYLMTQEGLPEGSISGTVTLEGQTDHSGVTVVTQPGGATATTDASGYYLIEDLYDATYTVEASKPDWSTAVVEGVVVSGGMPTTGVDMMLYPVTTVEYCSSPGLSIPDDNPSGIYDTITFTEDMDISEVEVYVDITHTYIGDLIVELTSPEGTTVRLHNRSGGSSDNIVGWYDSELAVDGPGSLSDYAGESSSGSWTLHVSDNAGADVGTLNEWCVRVTGGSPTGVEDGDVDVPVSHVLRGASPNPFNPVTVVSYGVPTETVVRLAVYNVAGRLVRTLVDGTVEAGYHSALWDGRDERGEAVGSGVYFCRMEAEGFEDTAKLVLLK